MKKIISIIAAALLVLMTCVPAFAAETVNKVPGNADISVYAKYVDNTDFTTISTDENGNGRITLPDGTEIIVNGAEKATCIIVVEEVTDREVLDWAKNQLGDKADGAKIYYVYLLNENGLFQPATGITVTIKPKDSTADSVYALGDSKTTKLQCKAENGAVTLTTDGSVFYALCRDAQAIPGDKAPQTGGTSNLVLWITLLLITGGVIPGVTIAVKKKKQQGK